MRFSLRLVGPRPLSGEIRPAVVWCTPGPMWRCRTGRHNQRGSFCTEIPPNARSAVCVCARLWPGLGRPLPDASSHRAGTAGTGNGGAASHVAHRKYGWGTPQVCRGHVKFRPMLCVCVHVYMRPHTGRAVPQRLPPPGLACQHAARHCRFRRGLPWFAEFFRGQTPGPCSSSGC